MIDRSKTGARIRLYEPRALPRYFVLFDETDGSKLQVELMWNGGNEGGLKFMTPPAK